MPLESNMHIIYLWCHPRHTKNFLVLTAAMEWYFVKYSAYFTGGTHGWRLVHEGFFNENQAVANTTYCMVDWHMCHPICYPTHQHSDQWTMWHCRYIADEWITTGCIGILCHGYSLWLGTGAVPANASWHSEYGHSSLEVACRTSDHWVSGSNPLGGMFYN